MSSQRIPSHRSSPAPRRTDADASSKAPAPKAKPQIRYQGGAQLKNAVLTPIYVGNYFNSGAGKAARTKEDKFAAEFGQSGIMGVLNQYGIQSSSFGGSSVVDRKVSKGQVFTQADIEKIVRAQMAKTPPGQAQRLYTVVLPPGAVISYQGQRSDRPDKSGAVLGGYHGSFKGPNGQPAYYAAITSGTPKNGIPFTKSSTDNATVIETHEWAEAMTDPNIATAQRANQLGDFDLKNNAELGDETQLFLGKHLGHGKIDRSREWTRQNGFAVQEIWSQRDDRFEVAPAKKGKA